MANNLFNLWRKAKTMAEPMQQNDKLRSLRRMQDGFLMSGDTDRAARVQEQIEALQYNGPAGRRAYKPTQPYEFIVSNALQGSIQSGSSASVQSGSNVFKKGDLVECVDRGSFGSGWKLSKQFTIRSIDVNHYGLPAVVWPTGGGLGVFADSLKLVTGGNVKELSKFKVGDRVKAIGAQGTYSDHKANLGKEGVVTTIEQTRVYVVFDGGQDGTYYAYQSPGLLDCLKNLTVKPKPRAKIKFSSVIIEDSKRDQILEALEQVNQSKLIFDTWGFGETMEKGKGVSMLFWGPPGTGKTLMAQAISDHLGYTLKVVGVADIESSAPGESERNIRKIFKEAKGAKTVLLFDECDSLIYNRSQVGAILGAQINELLSQIERFEGVTLFTTNRLGILDEAMNRRLALKLEFGMPTLEQRVKIWKRMFPKKAPIAKDIVWLKLAKVEIAGGYIKNTVLRAARMAAIQKVPVKEKQITMEHLVKSLQLEAKSMLEFDEARKTEERPAMVRDYVQRSASLERTAAW